MNLAVGIFPYVGNFASIGGFIFGFWLGFMFLMRPHHDWNSKAPGERPKALVKYAGYQITLWVIAAILLAIG